MDQPGPSRSKRKNTDPHQGHEESKHLAEDKTTDKPNEVVLDEENAAKLGDYLSAQYEILLRVLSNLSAFDLRRAAQVSKAWQSAARVIRHSRLQFHWLFWRAKCGGYNVPPPLALYSSICEHVFSQPTVCVAFFTKTAIKSFECSSPVVICPSTKEYKPCGLFHPMESYMSLALGPRCNIISLTVSGIIGSSLDLQSTFEVEHTRGVQSMSAALFPDLPGVKIVRFKVSKFQERMRKFQEEDLAAHLGLPSDMLLQALVLFCGFRIRGHSLSLLVSHLQSRQNHRFALAGGLSENPDSVEGLAILGDEVCAASLVVPESVTEKDDLVEHVTKIKNCNLPSDRSFCFMFTCLGRGHLWYLGEKDVESSAIRKLFPSSPLVGFFGGGEIGTNLLPNFQAQDSVAFWQNWRSLCSEAKKSLQKPLKTSPKANDIDHQYSTCILYLSFNTARTSLPI